jgi:predicted O-methyltransferase YrrM
MRRMGIEPVPGHQFQFTRRWFLNRNLDAFRELILPEWAGKPATYLEIGVFEGMSLVWMLQYVLTHPDAKAIGVDPYLMTTKLSAEVMHEVMQRALGNTAPWTTTHYGRQVPNCKLIRGNSAEVLRLMLKNQHGYMGVKAGSVDLCMVDGDHNALGVLDDCRLVWKLLKTGGWMICDDVENDRKKSHHVEEGLRQFLSETPGAELVAKKDYIEIYRKTE